MYEEEVKTAEEIAQIISLNEDLKEIIAILVSIVKKLKEKK